MAMYVKVSDEFSGPSHAPASSMVATIKTAMQYGRVITLQLDGDELDIVTDALQNYSDSFDANSDYRTGYKQAQADIRKALGI